MPPTKTKTSDAPFRAEPENRARIEPVWHVKHAVDTERLDTELSDVMDPGKQPLYKSGS